MALKQAWVSGPSTLRGGVSSDHSPEKPSSPTPHSLPPSSLGFPPLPSATVPEEWLLVALLTLQLSSCHGWLLPLLHSCFLKLSVPVIGKKRPFERFLSFRPHTATP